MCISFFAVEECKKRWKSIKDTYFRNKKKLKLGTGSSSSEKPAKWNLFEQLSFLAKIKHERKTKNTLTIDEFEIDSDIATEECISEDLEETSSPPLQTPIIHLKRKLDDQEEDIMTSDKIENSWKIQMKLTYL